MYLLRDLLNFYAKAFRDKRVLATIAFLYVAMFFGWFYTRRINELEARLEVSELALARAERFGTERFAETPGVAVFKVVQFEAQPLGELSGEKRALLRELTESGKYSVLKGDYDRALWKLDEALKIAAYPEALYYRGVALYGKGDYKAATQTWQKLHKMDIGRSARNEIALYLGLAYYRMDAAHLSNSYFVEYLVGQKAIATKPIDKSPQ